MASKHKKSPQSPTSKTTTKLNTLEAKKPAEIHIYEKGGHGFGMKKQGIPTDTWIDRFGDWLALHGYIKEH